MKLSARFIAIQNGENKYISENPCKNGHVSLRVTASGTCIECRKIRSRGDYAKNPKKEIEAVQKYYRAHAEEIKRKRREKYAVNREKENIGAKERAAEWRKNNPDKVKAHNAIKKRYKLENPARVRADTAKYRCAKMQRTPSWLTEDDFWMMEQAYELAILRSNITGFAWHVDHIYPLQGKDVSGLHVPLNLQVIPWRDNLFKANKLPENKKG